MRPNSVLFSTLILFFTTSAFAQNGEKLFKQNCAACHMTTDMALVGPGLQGMYDRAPSEEWLLEWVKDPAALIASGDEYANKAKDFSPAAMTAFGHLTDDEILAILRYAKDPNAATEVAEDANATASAATGAGSEEGEKIFKQNCAACHSTTDKTVVGPGLQGILDRVPSKEWFVKWVKDPDGMIASGDAYANTIKEFSPSAMTAFGYLEDEQILAILDYIETPSAPVATEVAAAEGGTTDPGPVNETSVRNILLGIAVLLVFLIIVLSSVRRSLARMVSEKTGDPAPVERGPLSSIGHWMNAHRGWTAIFGLILILSFLRWGFGELMQIGVYQGYKPTQPIAFSHKIHAGQNGINCVYCHTSAEKGKTAGIPSLNVCMNCHSYVSEGPSGTTEIAKIYEALDYDPKTRQYGNDPKPVEWVRIHNLPDLSYFNHSQHVVVGKIECQKCHGEIQEMEVVEQHSTLTMGWCVECHLETSVQVADNGYYEDLHKRTPEWHNGEAINVNSIGGLECGKCHY